MRDWLNSLPTMTLIDMSRKLGCTYTGILVPQRQTAINFLWQVSMSGTTPMTVAQFISYYNSLVQGSTPSYFVYDGVKV
jgi:hypothetical protein